MLHSLAQWLVVLLASCGTAVVAVSMSTVATIFFKGGGPDGYQLSDAETKRVLKSTAESKPTLRNYNDVSSHRRR